MTKRHSEISLCIGAYGYFKTSIPENMTREDADMICEAFKLQMAPVYRRIREDEDKLIARNSPIPCAYIHSKYRPKVRKAFIKAA